jgi:hypothetical protein
VIAQLISPPNRYNVILQKGAENVQMLMMIKEKGIIRLIALIGALTISCLLAVGCQEAETLKREVLKKLQSKVVKKNPFTPRDGMTMRACLLRQAANGNSEIIKKLPAETPVYLLHKVSEWYRVRTRDGREGYVEQQMIGGDEIIARTHELRRSIEGVPAQAEGVTKTKAYFRLYPGRNHKVVEALPPGKKFEVYDRVVTIRGAEGGTEKGATRGKIPVGTEARESAPNADDPLDKGVRKDVWYKVRIEDGRVGYIYTHNIKLTPPDEIAREVPFMRIVAWRTVSATDDPDRGAKNNYIAAFAPVGKDPGCDYTRLYFMNWAPRSKRRNVSLLSRLNGVLPITNFHSDGKPGFSVRYLHPSKKDKLVLANFVLTRGTVRKVSEEEIPDPYEIH